MPNAYKPLTTSKNDLSDFNIRKIYLKFPAYPIRYARYPIFYLTLDFLGEYYFVIHLKVIGGWLFCFAKLAIWRALPGPILVRGIPNGYYRRSKMKNAKRTLQIH